MSVILYVQPMSVLISMIAVNGMFKILNVKHTNIFNQTNIFTNNSVMSMIELIIFFLYKKRNVKCKT